MYYIILIYNYIRNKKCISSKYHTYTCTVYYLKYYFHLKDDISYKKVATLSPPSTAVNSEARNAIDGNIATCMRTGDIGLTGKHKTVWWKVDLGGVYNIYSVNIQFKNYDGYGVCSILKYIYEWYVITCRLESNMSYLQHPGMFKVCLFSQPFN